MKSIKTTKIAFLIPIASSLALAALLTACSSEKRTDAEPRDNAVLTIYSGQHERMARALADGFTSHTGIEVVLRTGKDGELANQIIEEDQRSRADILLTEEPGPIGDLARRGLLVTLPKTTLEKADSRFVPSDGYWLPFAARSRVFFYNPEAIDATDLPTSILELAKPEWKGRFAYAPSGAFRSTTAYLINTIGSDKTLEWLRAIVANGVNEQKNGKVRDSVEAGQHQFGLSNHYYWYLMVRQRGGLETVKSRVHFLNENDAGALLLASGAGVVRSSPNRQLALQFIDWLIAADGGQKVVAESSPQFPLNKQVESSHGLPAIDTLVFPEFDQTELNNIDEANELLKRAGMI